MDRVFLPYTFRLTAFFCICRGGLCTKRLAIHLVTGHSLESARIPYFSDTCYLSIGIKEHEGSFEHVNV